MNTEFECIASLPADQQCYPTRIICESEVNGISSGIYSLSKMGLMKFNLATGKKWSELYRIPAYVRGLSYLFNLGHYPPDGGVKIFIHNCSISLGHRSYIFDVNTKELSTLNTTDSLPPRLHLVGLGERMVRQRQFIYLTTGQSTPQIGSTEIHRLDLSTNSWDTVIAKNSAPEPRNEYEITMDDDGKIYVFGGWKSSVGAAHYYVMDEVPYFDTNLAVWSVLQTLPDSIHGYPRVQIHFGCVYYKNNVYIVGGLDKNRSFYSKELWRLDLSSGQWTKFQVALPAPHIRPRAAVDANGVLYVCGGQIVNADGSIKATNAIYLARLVPQSLERLAWDSVLKATSPAFDNLSGEDFEETCMNLGLTEKYMNKIKW